MDRIKAPSLTALSSFRGIKRESASRHEEEERRQTSICPLLFTSCVAFVLLVSDEMTAVQRPSISEERNVPARFLFLLLQGKKISFELALSLFALPLTNGRFYQNAWV